MLKKIVCGVAAALLGMLATEKSFAGCTRDSESGTYYYYAPSISIASPTSGASFPAQAIFNVVINAKDSVFAELSYVTRVQLVVDEQLVSTTDYTTQPQSVTVTVPVSGLAVGTHSLRATVVSACNRGANTTISVVSSGSSVPTPASTANALSAAKGAAPATANVTYTNNGNTAVTLSLGGISAPYSLSTNSCPLAANGGTCAVTVSMATSGAIGPQGTQTLVATGATTGQVNTPVSGTLTGSAVGAPANTAGALSATKGAAAPTGVVTYTNTGNVAASLSFSGISPPYSLSANGCTAPANNGSCSVNVSMATSGTIGPQGAQTLIASGATNGAVSTTINGTVNGSSVSVSTNSASALSANKGAASATGTVTYINTGNTDISLNLSGIGSPYSLSAGSCAVPANNGSCSVTVSMATSGAIGPQGAQTLIASGATTGAVNSSVNGTINGSSITTPSNSAGALSANKGAAAPTGVVTYTNTGNMPVTLNLGGISLPYSLSTNTCAVPANNGTCSVTVSMATSGAIGSQGQQTLTASGATTGTVSSVINGTINGSSVLAPTNTANALSTPQGAAPATGVVTYTNNGNIAATLALSGVNAPYSLSANSCLVDPGTSCSVTVTMPSTGVVGSQGTQTLTATGASSGPVTSTISGTITSGPSASLPPEINAPNAGTIPGSASTQAGKAAYQVAISLPPGVAGMVPSVSLTYGGGTSNGVAGVGWTLGASSLIQRCGGTVAQDGKLDATRLTSTDRLCLDGKRLIVAQSNADYWSATAEYRTEVFDGSRILRDGSGFKVFTKDGRIHYYGDKDGTSAEMTRQGLLGGTTATTHTWVIRRTEDRMTNAIDYSYSKDGVTGEHLLTAIRWGANSNASQTAFAKVAFTYEARPDADIMFIAGGRADVNKRLSAITGWTDTAADGSGGTQALQYRLTYEQSPTSGRSMLNAIQLCSASEGCLPATSFSWGKPDPNASRAFASKGIWAGPVLEDSGASGPIISTDPKYGHLPAEMYLVGDFDGDGLNDIITRYPHGTLPVLMYRNTGGGFTESTALPTGFDLSYFVAEIGDFDGDGQTDLLLAQGSNDSYGFLQQYINGGERNLPNWQVCYSRVRQGQGFQCSAWATPGRGKTAMRLVYDFNGDGLQDVYFSNDSYDDGQPLTGRICLSKGSNFNCNQLSNPIQLSGGDPESGIRPWKGSGTTDMDGDGRVDFISFTYGQYDNDSHKWLYTNGGGMRLRSYNENGTVGGYYFSYGTPPEYHTQGSGAGGDINGDGYSDVALAMYPTPNASTEWRRCLSTGLTGQMYCEAVVLATSSSGFGPVNDFDGDGAGEVTVAKAETNDTQQQSCALRAGGALACTTTWSFKAPTYPLAPNGEGNQKYSIDFSGNGVPDRVYYTPGGRWEVLTPTALAMSGEALDRLVQVTDGLGKKVRFDYAAPGDGTVYAADALDPNNQVIALTYPLRRTPRMGALVRAMRTSNGQGGWLETQYKYAGAARDMTGRGYAGFARVDTTDVASGITATAWFNQSWPYVGMTAASRQLSRTGNALSVVTNTLDKKAVKQPSGASTTIPYVKRSVADRRDLNSTALVSTTAIDATINDYGSPSNNTQTVTGGGKTFSTQTVTSFQNDETLWLLELPTRVVVTKVRDGVSVARTTTATYDAATGLAKTQTIEPDDAKYTVTTTLDRSGNPYGLVKTTTQAWRSPPPVSDMSRKLQDILSFDAKGRFLAQVLNALDQKETHQYDPRFGTRTQLTNANQVTSNWTVDGFGRVTGELPPDGTERRSYQKQCSASCPPWATHVQITVPLKAGTPYAASTLAYLDDSGRVLRTQTTGKNGKTIVADQRYDARGRATEADHPRFSDASAILASRSGYDDLNRVTAATVFDEGNVARTTSTDYNGLSTTVTNAKNKQIVSTVDVLGLLAQATDAAIGVTTYGRDPFGNLTQVSDPLGNVVTITYDLLGRRTDLRDPDLGWLHDDIDPVGRIWRHQTPNQRAASQVTTFTYDALDRMTVRSEPDLTSTWVYDSGAQGIGQLAEAYTGAPAAKDYRRVHTYDSLGRPSTTTTTLDTDYTTTTVYDAYSRVSQLSHRRGTGPVKTYDHIYSPQGPLQTIARAGQTLWQASVQDAAQRTTNAIFGNGLTEQQTFNPYSSRLSGASVDLSGDSRLVEAYLYDELGNVRQRVQWWGASGFTEDFGYDALNRLQTAQVAGQAAKSYTYDAIGNLTSKTGVGTGNYTYPASGAGSVRPHAVQTIPGLGSYMYDDNGNLRTAPNGADIVWKSFDMPDKITRGGVSDQFGYGPEHQRARQTRSDSTVLYYAGAMEVETKAGATTLKTYWPLGLGVEIDKPSQATELLWTHTDRLGSVIGITTGTGALKEKLAFDVWGKRMTTDGAATPDTLDGQTDNKGFTGHEMLDNVDMVHMNGRIYEPNIARFLSADPIIQEPEHSQSYNRYTYVWNNPTNMTDPTGFCADPASVASATKNAAACENGKYAPAWAREGGGAKEKKEPPKQQKSGAVPSQSSSSNSTEKTRDSKPGDQSEAGKGFVENLVEGIKVAGNFAQGWIVSQGYKTIIDVPTAVAESDEFKAGYKLRGTLGAPVEFLNATGLFGGESPLSSFGAAGGLQSVAKGAAQGPVIIGETMSRVELASAKYPGAKILNDMPDFKSNGINRDQVTSSMMQYNRNWILQQMRSGRQIIDIGVDVNRARPSIFYQMEQNMLKNYQTLNPEFGGVVKP